MSVRVAGLVALLIAAPALTHAQNVSTVRVTRGAAVLQAPDGAASVVGTANAGDVLELLDERSGWYLVRPPTGSREPWKTGWINGVSVEPMPVATPAPPPSDSPDARATAGRKGFIVGLGGGIGLHRASLPTFRIGSTTFGGGTNSDVGVVTDFKIGYAPTGRVLAYYTNSLIFSDGTGYDVVALTGGGVTYVHAPRAPSWFVQGAAGVATGAAVDFSGGSVDSVESGAAFSVGGGIEFARHWFLDGSAMFLTLEGRRHTVLKATINWIFY